MYKCCVQHKFFHKADNANGFLLNSTLKIQIMAQVDSNDGQWVPGIILGDGREGSISLFCSASVESLRGFLENRFIWK